MVLLPFDFNLDPNRETTNAPVHTHTHISVNQMNIFSEKNSRTTTINSQISDGQWTEVRTLFRSIWLSMWRTMSPQEILEVQYVSKSLSYLFHVIYGLVMSKMLLPVWICPLTAMLKYPHPNSDIKVARAWEQQFYWYTSWKFSLQSPPLPNIMANVWQWLACVV